jgi:hypothetical protein
VSERMGEVEEGIYRAIVLWLFVVSGESLFSGGEKEGSTGKSGGLCGVQKS